MVCEALNSQLFCSERPQMKKGSHLSNAHIENELRLNDDESLVRICVNVNDNESRYYVAIVVHPPNEPISFRAAESATVRTVAQVFAQRAIFNGRKAETVTCNRNHTTLSGDDIKFR